MKYWLMKSEPLNYSITDLKKDKTSLWDGVRNYQARNFMTKDMSKKDLALFYHSNCKAPGVYGLIEISKEAGPDPTCWDKKSQYFDPRSSQDKPRWFCVEVKFKMLFKTPCLLAELRKQNQLKNMLLLKKGMRLSIQPVLKKEFQHILKMAEVNYGT